MSRTIFALSAVAVIACHNAPPPTPALCNTVTRVDVYVSKSTRPRVKWTPACPVGLLSFDLIDSRGTRFVLWHVADTTNGIASGQTWPDSVTLMRLVKGTRYDVSVWEWAGNERTQIKLGSTIFIR